MKVVLVCGLKGGIGKTMCSTSIAYAFARRGIRVGIMDADIASPNVPEFFDVKDMAIDTKHRIQTTMAADDKIQIFSMAGLVDGESISLDEKHASELLSDVKDYVNWNCEYLIIDMPAGSGTIMRDMIKIFEKDIIGNIVVASRAHIDDLQRVLRWHDINGIRVIGVIENMSSFKCECGKTSNIFGEASVGEIAKDHGTDVIGSIPLSMAVRGAVQYKTSVGGHIAQTFDNIVSIILPLKPQRPGFLVGIMGLGKSFIRDRIIQAFGEGVRIANSEIPLADIQRHHGYAGNRDIRINILGDDMNDPISTVDMVVRNGKIFFLDGKAKPRVTIGVKAQALACAMVGYKKTIDGRKTPISLYDVYLNGDIAVAGERGDAITTVKFIKDTWEHVRDKQNGRLTKILEKLI